jgi:hypothetical protein
MIASAKSEARQRKLQTIEQMTWMVDLKDLLRWTDCYALRDDFDIFGRSQVVYLRENAAAAHTAMTNLHPASPRLGVK